MDDIVKQAMAKWPNVPACAGWLGLDVRGNWYLRDGAAQASGGFASGLPGAKGSLVEHAKLAEFIGRNYLVEPDGRWYFQNGPQRVYIELENTPWVWRARWSDGRLHLHSHTGVAVPADKLHLLTDELGAVYLASTLGLGVVHTQDVLDVAEAMDAGLLPSAELVECAALPAQFGFVRSPALWQPPV